MSVEYIRYRVPDDQSDAFVEAYRDASVPLLQSEYCIGFDLARCIEEPAVFVVRIEWTSTQDHMERFRSGKEFEPFAALVKPFIGAIEEMRDYEMLLPKHEVADGGGA